MADPDLVRRLHDGGRWKEALRVARRILAIHPGDSYTLYYAASCHKRLGHRWRALRFARRAVAADPFDKRMHIGLSLVYAWREMPRRAILAMRDALALDPEDIATHRAHARLFVDLDRYEEAIDAARGGLRLEPHDTDLLDTLAISLSLLGKHAAAEGVTRTVLHRDPEEQTAHARLGWIGLTGGSTRAAEENFREALRLDPHDDHAREGLLYALRSRFIVYRALFRFVLWVHSRPKWVRRFALAGGFAGLMGLAILAVGSPLAAPAALLPWLWLLCAFLGPLLVQPFVDLALRLRPSTVPVLRRDHMIALDLFAAFLLFVAATSSRVPALAKILLATAPLLASAVWHVATWPNLPSRRSIRRAAQVAAGMPLLWACVTGLLRPRLLSSAIAILVLGCLLLLLYARRLARRDAI